MWLLSFVVYTAQPQLQHRGALQRPATHGCEGQQHTLRMSFSRVTEPSGKISSPKQLAFISLSLDATSTCAHTARSEPLMCRHRVCVQTGLALGAPSLRRCLASAMMNWSASVSTAQTTSMPMYICLQGRAQPHGPAETAIFSCSFTHFSHVAQSVVSHNSSDSPCICRAANAGECAARAGRLQQQQRPQHLTRTAASPRGQYCHAHQRRPGP